MRTVDLASGKDTTVISVFKDGKMVDFFEADRIPARKIKTRTVNERLLRDFLRHRVHLHMYANAQIVRLLAHLYPVVNHLLSDLGLTIRRSLNESKRQSLKVAVGEVILTEQEESGYQFAKAKQVADTITELLNANLGMSINAIREQIHTMLVQLSVSEIDSATQMILAQVPQAMLVKAGLVWSGEIPVDTVMRMIDQPIGGLNYASRVNARYGQVLKDVKSALVVGLVHGEGIDDIVRKRLKPVLVDRLPYEIQRLARTEILRVSNHTLQDLYRRNADILKGEVWVATLDFKTCIICGLVLDGRRYNVGEGPVPPDDTHPNCRCLRAPVTKSWRELGVPIDEAPEGFRASMNGAVPASVTFEDFFKDADEAFQRRVLGKKRFELWQSGQIAFDQFATTRHIRTLRELQGLIND